MHNKFEFNSVARLLTGIHVTIIGCWGDFCLVWCPTQNRKFRIHQNNLREF